MPGYKFMLPLFLTIESLPSRKEEAKAAGASDSIVKPATPDELFNTINRVIRYQTTLLALNAAIEQRKPVRYSPRWCRRSARRRI